MEEDVRMEESHETDSDTEEWHPPQLIPWANNKETLPENSRLEELDITNAELDNNTDDPCDLNFDKSGETSSDREMEPAPKLMSITNMSGHLDPLHNVSDHYADDSDSDCDTELWHPPLSLPEL